MQSRVWQLLLCGCLAMSLLTACGDAEPPAKPALPPLVKELVFYNWVDDMPQSVLDAFTQEYGVQVHYVNFGSQEEAVETIRSGQSYDVAVLDNDSIPSLAAANRLAEIDFRNIPNFKNVSANFRDLATDPDNRHTVPYHFGTTGLLVRTDLIGHAVTRWADLWDPRYAGKVAVRAQPRELVALTLLSLGYSLNSENPQELDAALTRLVELKKTVFFVEVEAASAVPKLLSGEAVILQGWVEDYQMAHAANPAITYVLPQEGIALWGDNFVIPASSPHPDTAEVFINFLLRPEIGAQIVNEKKYATANEIAHPFIKPEIRDDPVIFPPVEMLRRAYFYAPLSPEGESLYRRVWERFLAGDPHSEQ
jgi:spermidine/putrescine transport system substrate-binding protein